MVMSSTIELTDRERYECILYKQSIYILAVAVDVRRDVEIFGHQTSRHLKFHGLLLIGAL